MSDKELLDLYASRDPQATAAMQQQYGAYCRSIISRILVDTRDVEECLNDVWLRVWNALEHQRPEYVKGWLATVARNCALNRLQKATKQVATTDDSTDELAQYLRDVTVQYTRNYIKTVYAEYVDMGSVTCEIIDVDRIEHNFKVKLNYRNDEITFNHIDGKTYEGFGLILIQQKYEEIIKNEDKDQVIESIDVVLEPPSSNGFYRDPSFIEKRDAPFRLRILFCNQIDNAQAYSSAIQEIIGYLVKNELNGCINITFNIDGSGSDHYLKIDGNEVLQLEKTDITRYIDGLLAAKYG